jgi:hypothetical protein
VHLIGDIWTAGGLPGASRGRLREVCRRGAAAQQGDTGVASVARPRGWGPLESASADHEPRALRSPLETWSGPRVFPKKTFTQLVDVGRQCGQAPGSACPLKVRREG